MGTIIDRFAKFVPNWGDEGCWLWTGSTIGHMGYGKTTLDGRSILAHRASYLVYIGEIPSDKIVMHTCDTPLCVRPDHLVLGTIADNQQDMARKGRGRLEHSIKRQRRRADALAKPCTRCGGPRVIQGRRVRCPKYACRGGQ
jgi:hypothetical protein